MENTCEAKLERAREFISKVEKLNVGQMLDGRDELDVYKEVVSSLVEEAWHVLADLT